MDNLHGSRPSFTQYSTISALKPSVLHFPHLEPHSTCCWRVRRFSTHARRSQWFQCSQGAVRFGCASHRWRRSEALVPPSTGLGSSVTAYADGMYTGSLSTHSASNPRINPFFGTAYPRASRVGPDLRMMSSTCAMHPCFRCWHTLWKCCSFLEYSHSGARQVYADMELLLHGA